MNPPLISVVIPSYNKVKYVEKTLKSIVSQNYTNYEVIIQDGGSNDGTVEIIKKYAKKYPQYVSFVSKKDGGQLDAINTGLKKAKGDIVTFINADDVYEAGAFESVVAHYIENPDALWFAGKGIVIDENDNELFQWGPRPVEAQNLFTRLKNDGMPKPDINKELHLWYGRNRGKEVEREIYELLKGTITL